jgi:hypothetical protein
MTLIAGKESSYNEGKGINQCAKRFLVISHGLILREDFSTCTRRKSFKFYRITSLLKYLLRVFDLLEAIKSDLYQGNGFQFYL